jgi:hypothetical protein
MDPIRSILVEELRKPHPHQRDIDAASAALLRATAPDVFRTRTGASPAATPQGSPVPVPKDQLGTPG